MQWIEVVPTEQLKEFSPQARCFQLSHDEWHITAILAKEPDRKGRKWWHLSLSKRTNTHTPEYTGVISNDEMKDARYSLIKDNSILMVEMFPPPYFLTETVGNVRHLWEVPLEFVY